MTEVEAFTNCLKNSYFKIVLSRACVLFFCMKVIVQFQYFSCLPRYAAETDE
jgi:hypothetical protein